MIAGVAVGIHVGRGDGVDDPFAVRRDCGFCDAMEPHHVGEGDGMFGGVLGAGAGEKEIADAMMGSTRRCDFIVWLASLWMDAQ